ncbi:helix-turn-helix transcriptional regulator [Zoogloea sp.]|uniref:helix-turn-helix transcriptional regulator n=1 Tax=Zoogloea sp. TaxID=49181 RepID=UPI0035B2FAC9
MAGSSVEAEQDEKEAQADAQAGGLDADSAALLARLSRNIRHFRGQRGMTRKNLAEQSGVSLPHLARMESAQGNVSVVVLGKVAKALNQPVASLFADEDARTGDFNLIVEFLKRQPVGNLARIREQIFADYQPTDGLRKDRIVLIGLRGAGKSTVGQALAERLGRPFVELNREVEQEAGLSLQEIITLYGQSGYRNLERRCLEQVVAKHPQVVLATGGGIVAEPLTYEILLNAFFTVWLHAEPDTHFRRVMDQHDIRIAKPALYREAMDNIHRTLEARDHLYRMAAFDVDTTQRSVDEVVARIAGQMGA